MSDKNPTAEYFATCTAIAEDIAARCRAGDCDDINDVIHENVDGNHYTIYTYAHFEVRTASDHWGECEDEIGWSDLTSGVDNFDALAQVYAYHAMVADVWDALREIEGFDPDDPDSWTETPDEDEDEDEERHLVGYDEDGDPIYETGPEDGDQVQAED